jgi:FkbM family methyltransferase
MQAEGVLYNGCHIIVPWNDAVGREILKAGVYEPETATLVQNYLKSGMTFFDIGAHVGQYTLIAAKCIGGKGTVHTFEPDPTTFEWLCRNVAINDLKNARLNRKAVDETSGTKRLYLASVRNIGANSLVSRPSTEREAVCFVETVTLDGYMQEHDILRADLIKIDVEGAELGVLRGARRLLSGKDRPSFILEFSVRQDEAGMGRKELYQFLIQNEYECRVISQNGLMPYSVMEDNTRFQNIMAIPNERAQEILKSTENYINITDASR